MESTPKRRKRKPYDTSAIQRKRYRLYQDFLKMQKEAGDFAPHLDMAYYYERLAKKYYYSIETAKRYLYQMRRLDAEGKLESLPKWVLEEEV